MNNTFMFPLAYMNPLVSLVLEEKNYAHYRDLSRNPLTSHFTLVMSTHLNPNWPTPNYVNPDTRGPALNIIALGLTSIVGIVIGLRYYMRFCLLKSFGSDDILIGLALVSGSLSVYHLSFPCDFYTDVCDGEIANIAAVVIIHLTTNQYDYNRHIWDIPPANLREGSMLQVPFAITLAMAITLVRLALCSFYRRLLLGSDKRTYIRCIDCVMVLVVLSQIALTLVTLLQCRSVRL